MWWPVNQSEGQLGTIWEQRVRRKALRITEEPSCPQSLNSERLQYTKEHSSFLKVFFMYCISVELFLSNSSEFYLKQKFQSHLNK